MALKNKWHGGSISKISINKAKQIRRQKQQKRQLRQWRAARAAAKTGGSGAKASAARCINVSAYQRERQWQRRNSGSSAAFNSGGVGGKQIAAAAWRHGYIMARERRMAEVGWLAEAAGWRKRKSMAAAACIGKRWRRRHGERRGVM